MLDLDAMVAEILADSEHARTIIREHVLRREKRNAAALHRSLCAKVARLPRENVEIPSSLSIRDHVDD